jgi:hypothetical protein
MVWKLEIVIIDWNRRIFFLGLVFQSFKPLKLIPKYLIGFAQDNPLLEFDLMAFLYHPVAIVCHHMMHSIRQRLTELLVFPVFPLCLANVSVLIGISMF